jgi:hypothetical protein
MLKLSCLCGQVRIEIPKRPDFIINLPSGSASLRPVISGKQAEKLYPAGSVELRRVRQIPS